MHPTCLTFVPESKHTCVISTVRTLATEVSISTLKKTWTMLEPNGDCTAGATNERSGEEEPRTMYPLMISLTFQKVLVELQVLDSR